MRLTEGDWSATLKQLRAKSFSKLKNFALNCCDEEEEVDARDYIVHVTNKDPIIEAREEESE